MAVIAPELSAKYELISPSGFRAVFNDASDPDFVGPLTEHSGFDSPEIREETENRPLTDGGLHGNFLFGRRPMTLTGKVLNPVSTLDRMTRLDKVSRAVLDCMRADGTLIWTLSTGVQLFTRVRTQQPLRIEGAWQKQFQIGLVASDPRFYAVASSGQLQPAEKFWTGYPISQSEGSWRNNMGSAVGVSFPLTFDLSFRGLLGYNGNLSADHLAIETTATNEGSAATPPLLTLTGSLADPIYGNMIIQNMTTGKALFYVGALAAGEVMQIDMRQRIITKNGANVYASLESPYSEWWTLVPGENRIRVLTAGVTNSGSLQLVWQNAWM